MLKNIWWGLKTGSTTHKVFTVDIFLILKVSLATWIIKSKKVHFFVNRKMCKHTRKWNQMEMKSRCEMRQWDQENPMTKREIRKKCKVFIKMKCKYLLNTGWWNIPKLRQVFVEVKVMGTEM